MLSKEPYDGSGAKIYKEFRHADADVVNLLLHFIGGNNFLDAGCGTGNNLAVIHERTGRKGYGCDISPHMLEIAQERNCAQDLKLIDLDSEFPFDQEFEVIYAMDVIHHLIKPEVFFKNSLRHLQPAGQLLVGTEAEEDLRNKLISKYFPGALEIDLARYFSVEKLRQIARKAGFQSVVVEKLRGETEVTDEYIQQCRNKAHSVLTMLDDASFQASLQNLEADFLSGGLKLRTVGYTFLTISR